MVMVPFVVDLLSFFVPTFCLILKYNIMAPEHVYKAKHVINAYSLKHVPLRQIH